MISKNNKTAVKALKTKNSFKMIKTQIHGLSNKRKVKARKETEYLRRISMNSLISLKITETKRN